MEQLSKKIYDKKYKKIKIMQFGEGNFLRAFTDWIIQKMNDNGSYDGHVVVVQPMPFGRVEDLEKQDGLYTLYLQGIDEGKPVRTHEVIDVLDDFINPFTQYDKYMKYAESEDLEVVISNTTEAGIALDKNDTDFSKCPSSFPGKLLAFLKHRYDHFGGDYNRGLCIIACELIDNNADELHRILLELADIKGYDDDFKKWLDEANHYSSTLVDRIVPGYPRDEIATILDELGYEDTSIVKGEIFHLWVLKKEPVVEEKFPCHKANLHAIYAESIKPYKERKVKILNGTHTAIVPVAYLAGFDTVRETIEDKYLGTFARNFIFNEVIPTIDLPHDEMVFFANSVLERYLNPYVRHELMSIALNSVSKYKARILKTVHDYIERTSSLPRHALFSLAALILFYRGKRGEASIALNDDKLFIDIFACLWAKYDENHDLEKLVKDALGWETMWGEDLNKIEGFAEMVTEFLRLQLEKGMKIALISFLGE